MNQMVAVGLLEDAGHVADVEADGEEAVAALVPGHGYAAVLMDCRMPRLDGFGATRAVRAAEPDGVHVPIIAMTASALEGEEERCREAGMDGFLTKPVREDGIESRIAGTFKGWEGRTLFKLENGQQWVQVDGQVYIVPARKGPDVEIVPSSLGGWKMWIQPEGRWIRVKRVQ